MGWCWAGAGVVQAFIIALYAEMYGFPLTIYLLVRFFGLDSEYVSASLWSTLVGLGETGMLIAMMLGYALAFTGIGLFIQGWRQVHKARGENRLVTDGLYAYVRHPQYTWLARREEQQVLKQFGEEYRAYQQKVPMFIPRWGQWRRLAAASQDSSNTKTK